MKKIIAIILAASMLFALTGCVRTRMTIKMNEDGSGELIYLTAAAESTLTDPTDLSEVLDDESLARYEELGYEIEEYAEDGYVGYILKSTITDDISSFEGVDPELGGAFASTSVARSYFVGEDSVIFGLKVYDGAGSEEMLELASQVAAMDGFYEITMEFPVAPLSSNATSVSDDGRTLTWDLLRVGEIGIEFDKESFIAMNPGVDLEQFNHFTDVYADDYYYDAVLWAKGNGITTGTSETTFSPDDDCTRAQVVTWLWRAMGEEEPMTTENPFTDVTESDYFYKAVLWAVENGITNGTSATKFSPDTTCSHGHILTFLYRALGREQCKTGDEWYSAALDWANRIYLNSEVEVDVIDPMAPCKRADVVQYLYIMFDLYGGIFFDIDFSDFDFEDFEWDESVFVTPEYWI